ncbi:ATP-binding protein [Streptomyces sp. NPDC058220]|uniref:ATP-binding protein n=1 Tax=Streptomyces sp. NPDC058220 TaxID=3346387 RepID=UPI0036E34043
MKKSAVKTLGVTALGVAFAATAAGSASAAAPAAPDAGTGLDLVTKTLPMDEAAGQLPVPTSASATAGRTALGAVQQTGPYALRAAGTTNPPNTLLGGLPVNGLGKGGLPVNGLGKGGLPVNGPGKGGLPVNGLAKGGLPVNGTALGG